MVEIKSNLVLVLLLFLAVSQNVVDAQFAPWTQNTDDQNFVQSQLTPPSLLTTSEQGPVGAVYRTDLSGHLVASDASLDGYHEELCRPIKDHFSYDEASHAGPSHWVEMSKCCGGRMQSPIALSRNTARCMSAATPHYNLNLTMAGSLKNSGHHVMLTFGAEAPRPSLYNVETKSETEYVLDHIHMHFGHPFSARGSEHVIDGRAFQGEIHMVHYLKKHGSVEKAIDHKDGLVVLALPVSTSHGDHSPLLEKLIFHVNQLKGVGDEVPFSVAPLDLLPPPARRNIFYYRGSLTTPPCSESVQFIVMDQPLRVPRPDMHVLWSLPSRQKGVAIATYTNLRPLRPVNSRVVRTNFICWCCVFPQ